MMTNKYSNKKVIVNGHEFDSIAESKYYEQLKWLLASKQIKSFKLQPRYLLQEAFKKNGITFRKIEYVADFEVHRLNGSIEIIDIKGAPPTAEFKLKHKLFEHKYLQSLKVIFYKPEYGGFITWERLKEIEKKVKSSAKKKPRVGATVSKRRRARRLSLC
ncbi:MAG TPA: DUF1064 domain-containing protein [Ureibacillus sp.]|uniref:DUF1064 domain-containing protein n=1 Tax=Peribacillus asahii TaxID=228899 RepID=UPI00207A3BB3|nr:DUF1064 domain-containing protein [Peribacillus asahii]USK62024.1 DUF1064 domain-containing protein [Peribacillus asahii]HWL26765.1 DUF1064 domain-containing protein [Ureibacillus sp.]